MYFPKKSLGESKNSEFGAHQEFLNDITMGEKKNPVPQIFFPKPSDIYKWTIFPKIVVLVAHRETSGGTLRRGEYKERECGGWGLPTEDAGVCSLIGVLTGLPSFAFSCFYNGGGNGPFNDGKTPSQKDHFVRVFHVTGAGWMLVPLALSSFPWPTIVCLEMSGSKTAQWVMGQKEPPVITLVVPDP